MSQPSNSDTPNLGELSTILYGSANRLWKAAYSCQFVVFLTSLLVIGLSEPPWDGVLALVALTFTVGSELLLIKFEQLRGLAEMLRRKLDLQDGFGWGLSRDDLGEIVAQCPSKVIDALSIESLDTAYFASSAEVGPRRALENLQETAWWSKHLAAKMRTYAGSAAAILIIVPLAGLLLTARTSDGGSTVTSFAHLVTLTLTFAFGLGLLRLAVAYHAFHCDAERSEAEARQTLKGDTVDLPRALRLLGDYHVARVVAPPLSPWVWTRNRDRLNALWRAYFYQTHNV